MNQPTYAEPKHKSQADRILALLRHQGLRDAGRTQDGGWVKLTAILALGIASHTRRIFELRKTWNIEMREKWVDRERHIEYRLAGRKEQAEEIPCPMPRQRA